MGMGRVWDGYGMGMGRVWDGYGTDMGQVWDGYETGMGRVIKRCSRCAVPNWPLTPSNMSTLSPLYQSTQLSSSFSSVMANQAALKALGNNLDVPGTKTMSANFCRNVFISATFFIFGPLDLSIFSQVCMHSVIDV